MSISKKISILFFISFILMSVIGFWIDNINSKRVDNLVKEKYLNIANELFSSIETPTELKRIVEQYGLRQIDKVTYRYLETLYYKKHTFGYIKIDKPSFDDEFIIYISFLNDNYIFKTPDVQNLNEKTHLNGLIFLDIFILLLTFAYILKLLQPLKTITKEIENFSKGDLSSRSKIYSNDEIGTLSQTFNTMAIRLEELITTREELLRDIGHELRTPIAKGKFAIEKIDDFSQKELLKKIFIDLETLTNELLELEKLNSSKLDITTFSAETLILESLSKLYITDESFVQLNIENDFEITGDLHYLCLALKNIIDNGLKYATKLPIYIEVVGHKIVVKNFGDALNKDFEHYLKPFTQAKPQRDGFGLGLSIVKKIINKHHFALHYQHKDGQNHFELTLD